MAGYLIINIAGIHLPSLEWKPSRYTYIVYTYVKQHSLRNCGMFWEPGAFAGIITLALALNINELPRIWSKYKFKVIMSLESGKNRCIEINFILNIWIYINTMI